MLNVSCPDGFVHGKLQSHHTSMVSSQWPRLHDWPNKELYFKELIENYSTTSLFHVDNLDIPVAYAVQLPCGQNFGFTMEQYRKKGLIRYICQKQVAKEINEGCTPIEEESSADDVLIPIKGQAVKSGFNVKDLVLKQTFTIISKL